MTRLLLPLILVLLAACSQEGAHEALGTLERDRIILKSTADEIIVGEPVSEGTMVAAGTVLVQLDDRRQQAAVARARAEVAGAEARLKELRNGARPEEIAAASAQVEGARAGLVEAQANYRRNVELVRQKLTAQASLDRALARRDAAEA
ncbi:MAG: biotin/lipoyl-binding protein, partial [Halioglobus sp.]|nr:biotin/lipoyl-binding protein [Halioglobus sp.]